MFVVLALLTLLSSENAVTWPPRFEQFRVDIADVRNPRVDLSSHAIGRKYRTRIRRTVSEAGVNFAGHFTAVTWGCGSSCSQLAIVDLKTGTIWHDPEIVAARGYEFRPNSRLLLVNPAKGVDVVLPHVPVTYYWWTGKELRKYAPKLRPLVPKPRPN